MTLEPYWIRIDYGAPLGTGRRMVLAQVGGKWVKVKPCTPWGMKRPARRIPREEWDEIVVEEGSFICVCGHDQSAPTDERPAQRLHEVDADQLSLGLRHR